MVARAQAYAGAAAYDQASGAQPQGYGAQQSSQGYGAQQALQGYGAQPSYADANSYGAGAQLSYGRCSLRTSRVCAGVRRAAVLLLLCCLLDKVVPLRTRK